MWMDQFWASTAAWALLSSGLGAQADLLLLSHLWGEENSSLH